MLEIFLVCLGVGAVVGVLAGMLGIGGGLIIVPTLNYLLMQFLGMDSDIAMPMSIATSLATIIFTGMSSARAHARLGNLNRQVFGWVALGIAGGAIIGAQIASMLSGDMLTVVFASFVLVIAAQMLFGKKEASSHQFTAWVLVLIGLVVGAISAFMGIGGGALLVPALVWFRVDMRQAIGTAAFSGLVIALFGTASFVVAGLGVSHLPQYSLGYVYLPAALGIAATSVFTANFGAKLGQKMPTAKLKMVFACLLVLVSIKMMIGI